ncbi:hypothetical protein PCH_Pc22g24100 [Penicillium rubens Wisconsin 54-1255]|uniref:Uncharacterized protein n=1 Tax=Penicillium rubens (strain ATCC 28089 / DSM 1075 / NRRL 1951 / Wisconsin 54-1255) TaxID=500485 RepID=B6HQ57_PENRW|nr:hypothetical protein PCH_Pc22g24100 [Penicillium rubens Wisconsin 54-1255]
MAGDHGMSKRELWPSAMSPPEVGSSLIHRSSPNRKEMNLEIDHLGMGMEARCYSTLFVAGRSHANILMIGCRQARSPSNKSTFPSSTSVRSDLPIADRRVRSFHWSKGIYGTQDITSAKIQVCRVAGYVPPH